MMYNNKLVVAVKVNGKVLREFGDKVYIPFGAEYSLLIKNLSGVRAQVQIEIDGTSATDGENLIVYANQEVELQRFIKNGNLKNGNRFKFIERTAGIEEGPRGVKLSDGLIRVSYQFEKVVVLQPQIIYDYYPFVQRRSIIREYWDNHHSPVFYSSTADSLLCSDSNNSSMIESAIASAASAEPAAYAANVNTLRSKSKTLTSGGSASFSAASATLSASSPTVELNQLFNAVQSRPTLINDTGITVPGSKSDQEFRTVADFPVTDDKFSIVLHLLGQTEQNQQVTIPVTVKAKPKCSTCGHTNKAKAKFCSECGTSLEII